MGLFSLILIIAIALLVDWSVLLAYVTSFFATVDNLIVFDTGKNIGNLTLSENRTFANDYINIVIRDESMFRVIVNHPFLNNQNYSTASLFHLRLNATSMEERGGIKPGYRIFFLSYNLPFFLDYDNVSVLVRPPAVVNVFYNPTAYGDFVHRIYDKFTNAELFFVNNIDQSQDSMINTMKAQIQKRLHKSRVTASLDKTRQQQVASQHFSHPYADEYKIQEDYGDHFLDDYSLNPL